MAYVSPIEGTIADNSSGQFGAVRDGGSRKHAGNDFQTPAGSPALAVIGGKVIYVGDNQGYRHNAVILGDDGNAYRYATHQSIGVKLGQRVEQGQKVGTVGGIGNGRSHLHFEVIPSTSPAFKKMVANPGQFVSTSWYPGGKPLTTDPAKVLGVNYGDRLVAGAVLGTGFGVTDPDPFGVDKFNSRQVADNSIGARDERAAASLARGNAAAGQRYAGLAKGYTPPTSLMTMNAPLPTSYTPFTPRPVGNSGQAIAENFPQPKSTSLMAMGYAPDPAWLSPNAPAPVQAQAPAAAPQLSLADRFAAFDPRTADGGFQPLPLPTPPANIPVTVPKGVGAGFIKAVLSNERPHSGDVDMITGAAAGLSFAKPELVQAYFDTLKTEHPEIIAKLAEIANARPELMSAVTKLAVDAGHPEMAGKIDAILKPSAAAPTSAAGRSPSGGLSYAPSDVLPWKGPSQPDGVAGRVGNYGTGGIALAPSFMPTGGPGTFPVSNTYKSSPSFMPSGGPGTFPVSSNTTPPPSLQTAGAAVQGIASDALGAAKSFFSRFGGTTAPPPTAPLSAQGGYRANLSPPSTFAARPVIPLLIRPRFNRRSQLGRVTRHRIRQRLMRGRRASLPTIP